jgi:dihydropteroate synthase
MIGRILGRDTRQRLAGGLALATLAAQQGVAVVRTHDVRATRDVLAMVAAVRKDG